MQIPTGSRFILVTDDTDDATEDKYIKLANHEIFQPTVDGEITNYRIHACPNAGSWDAIYAAGQFGATMVAAGDGTSLSSVESWDNFIDNSSDADTLYANVTGVTSGNSGIISSIVFNGDGNATTVGPHVAGVQYTIDSSFGDCVTRGCLIDTNSGCLVDSIIYRNSS